MFLFFDTETTGLPANYKAPVTDVLNWPRLVQLAIELWNDKGEFQFAYNQIILPLGFEIPEKASAIHGITTQIAREKGIFLQRAMMEFSWMTQLAQYIVGHNLAYDRSIVSCELFRCGMENILAPALPAKQICTMDASKEFCSIPFPDGTGCKWPKLNELYFKLFGRDFENAHDAKNDVHATAECFFELIKRKIIVL